jgi:hypothetical protein
VLDVAISPARPVSQIATPRRELRGDLPSRATASRGAGRYEDVEADHGGAMEADGDHVPVTVEHYSHIEGPFFHGTRVALEVGDELVPGYGSNYQQGRTSNNIYFAGALETAVWGAELATALSEGEGRGRIYVVEPLGPFEDDPNVTNKRFPGNPTRSYRSRSPLRIVSEVDDWQGHSPEVLGAMLGSLRVLREQGRDLIEDEA